jgi:hypothetical protein
MIIRLTGNLVEVEEEKNGIDLSLIRENLKLTPLERIGKGD